MVIGLTLSIFIGNENRINLVSPMLLCVNNLPHQPAYQKGRTSIALQQNPLAQHALPKNGKKKKKLLLL